MLAVESTYEVIQMPTTDEVVVVEEPVLEEEEFEVLVLGEGLVLTLV